MGEWTGRAREGDGGLQEMREGLMEEYGDDNRDVGQDRTGVGDGPTVAWPGGGEQDKKNRRTDRGLETVVQAASGVSRALMLEWMLSFSASLLDYPAAARQSLDLELKTQNKCGRVTPYLMSIAIFLKVLSLLLW